MTGVKRILAGVAGTGALVLSFGGVAAAHVVVKPGEAVTGNYQTFTMGVPNEKQQPTVSVRLDVPRQIQSVTPTVMPGWTITIGRDGTGEAAKVKSVTWAGGTIGEGMRSDFTFSAKTPDQPTDLQWKAYQTYADGSVVSWDQAAAGHGESADKGPLSITKVTAADTTAVAATSEAVRGAQRTASRAQTIALLALAFALLSFALITRTSRK